LSCHRGGFGGLTLGALAFWVFRGGGSTFVGSFDKSQILILISPTDAAPQKLEIHLKKMS